MKDTDVRGNVLGEEMNKMISKETIHKYPIDK